MKMNNKRLVTLAVGGITALTMSGLPYNVMAAHPPVSKPAKTYSNYVANLDQLNNTGVSGQAKFKFNPNAPAGSEQLKAQVTAEGTVPGQTHAVHIHGKDNPEVALCPSVQDDTNDDGFVSVLEGAPAYGPIKVNLTSPQTPFGTSPSPALFAPFAGTPSNANFPVADAEGNVSVNQTYNFDMSDPARAAFDSVKKLENQHVVVHGGFAPASVDADAFAALGMPITVAPGTTVYDTLLPVACGQIDVVDKDKTAPAPVTPAPNANPAPVASLENKTKQFNDRIMNLKSDYESTKASAQERYKTQVDSNKSGEARDQYIGTLQAARDRYVNQFYEARNLFVDQANRMGNVEMRNQITNDAEKKLTSFSEAFEVEKNQITLQR